LTVVVEQSRQVNGVPLVIAMSVERRYWRSPSSPADTFAAMGRLVGMAHIAKLPGINRQRVHQLT
jgi:hypothetical protein